MKTASKVVRSNKSVTTSTSTSASAPPPVDVLETHHQPPPDPGIGPLREAFEGTAHDRSALTDEQLAALNVDIETAVGIVLFALPALRALRPRLVALSEFDIASLDRLETFAHAAWYADRRYDASRQGTPSLADLAVKAAAVRDDFMVAARALAARKLLSADALAALSMSNAHRDIADTLLALVLMFEQAWENIAGRTVLTRNEVDQAGALGRELTMGVFERDSGPARVADAARDRVRAFTLFARAYDEVRAAVAYLCRKSGDADKLAPTIHVRSAVYAGPKPSTREPAAAASTPSAPSPAAKAPSAPTAPPSNPARIASPFVDE